MSYPRPINVLIIEDEKDALTAYDQMFKRLSRFGIVSSVRYAYSYQQASEALKGSRIYHLVILDLQLPEELGLPAAQGVNLGLALLKECESRNDYPIPALLVVSGHLGTTYQADLQSELASYFFYGRTITKGMRLRKDIVAAIRQIRKYCDIGIHIRDGGEYSYPAISPRDEDLLRRAVAAQEIAIGVDLKWWAAEYGAASEVGADFAGWTSTLMGQFVLDQDRGLSRPTFFKIFPSRGSEHVVWSTRIMQQKLEHVKLLSSITAGRRCILATQKVGAANCEPIQFSHILNEDRATFQEQATSLVGQICEQVSALGDEYTQECSLKGIFDRDVALEDLKTQWERYVPSISAQTHLENPFQTRKELSMSDQAIYCTFQSCHHGDLNITNIAVDKAKAGLSAFIFDAGYCSREVNVRDLAMIEVTSLLHQATDVDLPDACRSAYEADVLFAEDAINNAASDLAANTLRLIREIRAQALKRATPEIYALMVFDIATRQLWGLSFSVSRNKIKNPTSAARLASLASGWLRRNACQYFEKQSRTIGEDMATVTGVQ